MKSRETKQRDLNALQESLQNSKSAVLVSFSGLTVTKDQEFRNSLREAGAQYQVVKNTLARIAVKGTQFEEASEYFKGVTAIAWTQNDPVVLTKTISKFLKDNADVYKYKSGVLDGKVIDFAQLQTIANLPSKEELISKLLWVLNSSATGIVSVINAVPRNLAVVIKQIGDEKPAGAAAPAEAKAEEPAAEASTPEAAPAEASAPEAAPAQETSPEASAAEAAPAEAESAPSTGEAPAVEEPPVENTAVEAVAPTEVEAADDSSAEVVAEAPAEASTEAETEAASVAPDDASEAVVEGESEAKPEAAADGEATE